MFTSFFSGRCCIAGIVIIISALLSIESEARQAAGSIDFPASDIADISTRYAGSPQNWPVVNSLADYNPQTNRFYLTADDIRILENFRTGFVQVSDARSLYTSLIDRGARVLAREELEELESMFDRYRASVNAANIPESNQLASQIAAFSDAVDALVDERRLMAVEARLEERETLCRAGADCSVAGPMPKPVICSGRMTAFGPAKNLRQGSNLWTAATSRFQPPLLP